MFTINIKGKKNHKSPQLVKSEIVFFKTGYARVTKTLTFTGGQSSIFYLCLLKTRLSIRQNSLSIFYNSS